MKLLAVAVLTLTLSATVQAQQQLINTNFIAGTDHWSIHWGFSLRHVDDDGDLTPNGAAMVTGPFEEFAGIRHDCVDISGFPAQMPFRVAASIKPTAPAGGTPLSGIIIDFFSDADCGARTANHQIPVNLEAGVWSRVEGNFVPPGATRSLQVILLTFEGPEDSSVLFDDASLIPQFMDNPDFNGGVSHWTDPWSRPVEYIADDGHLTPGSAQTTGYGQEQQQITALRANCVNIDRMPPLSQLHAGASVKMSPEAPEDSLSGLLLEYYRERSCVGYLSADQAALPSQPGMWVRSEGHFVPPPQARSASLIMLSTDTPQDGLTRFDDATLTLDEPVRQFWLIGVGTIQGNTIQIDEMVYTRSGAFGAVFDPAAIDRKVWGSLSLTFNGCNSGNLAWSASGSNARGFGSGGYPVVRLAANAAVQYCEEQGFGSVTTPDWMAGYWFGQAARDGEGLGVDVLQGGTEAVVTWYSYLPLLGSDAGSP